MNKKNNFILLFCLLATTLTAQLKFNLKQAISYGLEHSPSARSIKASYSSAQWNYIASRSYLLPSLRLQGNIPGYVRQINGITQPNGTILYRQQSLAYSTGAVVLEQNITPTGGSIFMSSGLARNDQFGVNGFTQWQASPMQFGLSQPLFKVNRLRWNWKLSKLQYEFNKRQAAEALEDLSINIATAFFDYYITNMQLKNAEYNAAMNDTFYRIAEGRFSVGKIGENEKLQSELNLMNAQNSVEQTRIRLITTEKQLKNLLGIPESQKVEVVYEETLPLYSVELDKAMTEAKENRSNYVGFELQLTDADIAIREASVNRGFTGDLTFTYGLNQTSGQLESAYKDLLNSQSFTVGFSLPLLNFGRNKASYMVAKNDKDSRLAQIENNRNSLDLEIMNNVLQFNQLKRILEISAKSDTIARQRYEISTNRFRLGKIDLTNLTIAQNEKDQALINHIRNLQNFWVAYYQLRRLTLFDFEIGGKIVY